MGMTLDGWVDLVRAELALGPVDRDLVLDLARDVAHGVARPAAPLTAFLVGLAAGRAGGDEAAVRDAARQVLALLEPPGPAEGAAPGSWI